MFLQSHRPLFKIYLIEIVRRSTCPVWSSFEMLSDSRIDLLSSFELISLRQKRDYNAFINEVRGDRIDI